MKNLSLGFIVFLFTTLTFAQTYQYQLKGNYKLSTSAKTQVQYQLQWSEENGNIQGIYSDNYFAQNAKVKGTLDNVGRTFTVAFPEAKKGVNSVIVLSNVQKNEKTSTTVPVSVITRDALGNPLTTVKTSSQFNSLERDLVAQRQEESGCQEKFGVLAGFCGIYSGTLTEEQDRRNRCNLLFADAVRLELTEDQTVLLHLGEVNEIISTPGHSIGRLPVDPQSNRIDVLSRVCGSLTGVNSSSDTCKRIHLYGVFSRQNDRRHFNGTYTITEEGTNNMCRYGLSMDQQ